MGSRTAGVRHREIGAQDGGRQAQGDRRVSRRPGSGANRRPLGRAATQTGGLKGPEGREPGLRRLGQAHIDRLEPLRPFLKIELDRLTLFEGAEAVHLDGGVVHEYIGPSIRL